MKLTIGALGLIVLGACSKPYLSVVHIDFSQCPQGTTSMDILNHDNTSNSYICVCAQGTQKTLWFYCGAKQE